MKNLGDININGATMKKGRRELSDTLLNKYKNRR
jgi:hypothetical protein